MKSFFLVLVLIAGATFSMAQCSKDLLLTGSKTEYLDAAGTVGRTVDENSLIEITKSRIVITPGNPDQKMTGTILSDSCNWSVPFKVGRTFIVANLTDERGVNKVNITIEGKDNKVYLVLKLEARPNHIIRVTIDKFEEKK